MHIQHLYHFVLQPACLPTQIYLLALGANIFNGLFGTLPHFTDGQMAFMLNIWFIYFNKQFKSFLLHCHCCCCSCCCLILLAFNVTTTICGIARSYFLFCFSFVKIIYFSAEFQNFIRIWNATHTAVSSRVQSKSLKMHSKQRHFIAHYVNKCSFFLLGSYVCVSE